MKTIRYLFLSFAAAIFLISCDEVDAPYLIEVGGADTSACPVPEFPHIHNPVKRVLLEDYTGHLCVNCPTAAALAHDLETALGNKLVVITVHAGFFANPMSGDYEADFRTEAGTAWDNFFGISKVGNPNGMVDRVGYNTEHILSPGAWSNALTEQLAKPPEVSVEIINDYQHANLKLCTHIQVEFINETDRNLNMCAVITEHEIIAPQKNNNPEIGSTPDIMDYIHTHVLRDAINTAFGINIATKGTIIPAETEIIKTYEYIINDAWDPYQCTVVAFVYDADTYEVLQVAETPVD